MKILNWRKRKDSLHAAESNKEAKENNELKKVIIEANAYQITETVSRLEKQNRHSTVILKKADATLLGCVREFVHA